MSETRIPPGWVLEHHCVCGAWHEITESVTVGGVPILPCPDAPPGHLFGMSVPGRPRYRVRER